jgi:hypothetical protein
MQVLCVMHCNPQNFGMRYVLIIIIFLYGCASDRKVKPSKKNIAVKSEQVTTSTYNSQEINAETNIINTAHRDISVLYNSIDHFLKRTDTTGVYFITECLGCQPVQPYQDHLLFGNQLEIFTDHVVFHKEKILTDTPSIKRVESYGDRKPVKFSFLGGRGRINYIKQSCNDADLYTVNLQYNNGEVKIGNVLNASFFEYDLNKDGKPEQYILANRNCSQELAVVRIL